MGGFPSAIPNVAILAAMIVFYVVMVASIVLTDFAVVFAKRAPETRRERLAATTALATFGSFLVGGVLAPPEPFSQILWSLGGLMVTVPVAHLYVTHAAAVRD